MTQKEIALSTGFSQMTVSLALRAHPSIPLSTQKYIKSWAKKLNYSPDPVLSSLVAYRRTIRPVSFHGTLAWLNAADHEDAHLVWPELRAFMQGAEKRGRELGFWIETKWLRDPTVTPTRLRQIIRAAGIQGIILPPQSNLERSVEFDWNGCSVVQIGDYTSMRTDFNLVTADHGWAMQEALKQIENRGYQSVAFVTSQNFEERLNFSYASAYEASKLHRSRLRRIDLFCPNELNAALFCQWYRAHKPEALILPNNLAVIPCLNWVENDLKLKIPRDIGICFTCLPNDNSKRFTGIDEGHAKIGERTVDYLVDMMNRNEHGKLPITTRHLIHGSWIEGETLKKIS